MLLSISSVSAIVVGSTITFWKRRSRAPSFSMFLRYSSSVVAPMHCISPRARAGLSILAASMEPCALPAPTMVCISSINSMTSGFLASSSRMFLMRSSNSPRYFVPATMEAMSSDTTRLPKSTRDTWRCMMRSARPSTMALLPTPGSPISTGLFFLRRLRICARRSISVSRPTTGSSLSSAAARVMSCPNLSNIGVSDAAPLADLCEPRDGLLLPCGFSPGASAISPSSVSPKEPTAASACSVSAVCVVPLPFEASAKRRS